MVAVTAWLPFIVTVHVAGAPVTGAHPLQLANTALPVVLTVSVTVPPLANDAAHMLPQLMPAGLLVIVPLVAALPVRLTVS